MRTATSIPLIEPTKGVTEELIQRLVRSFYSRVLQEPELGPIFQKALAHRWDEHLAIMDDFWSSIALRTGRYHGKPQAAHRGLHLSGQHFERWLALFEETARETCEPDVAAFFIDRSNRIAESLQIGLDIGPKALNLPPSPSEGGRSS